jgi:hypothetical protein
MRHRATGIVYRYLLEFLLRLFVPKRMQQSNAALKWLLNCRGAGHWEYYRPKLCRRKIFVMMMALLIIGHANSGKYRKRKSTRTERM